MSQTGLLIRAHGGFFDVETEAGMLRCRARGRLHLDGIEPLPGDRVVFEADPHHTGFGILTDIAPRKNAFIRPNVANLDQLVFIATVARPETDPYLIDMMSVVADASGCEFLLCINKTDLVSARALEELYHNCGFEVMSVSAATGEGLEQMREALRGKISAMTGNSGVGKTSLLNLLLPGLQRETGEISPKHGRGRHTTRLTELFPLPDSGYVADTPGFASLEFTRLVTVEPENLADCFPEFPSGRCRFPDCLHRSEPGCAVRMAVETREIVPSRYRSYLRLLQDAQSLKEY